MDCSAPCARSRRAARGSTTSSFFAAATATTPARARCLTCRAALRPLVYVRDLPSLVGIRRLGPPPLALHVSADWLTLGRRAVAALLAAGADRRLTRYFRRVVVPSEAFFASVLLNDRALAIERDHRRFASFSRPGAPHPDTLTSLDLDRILISGADFARKFDTDVDREVLDRLDEHRR